MSVKFICPDCGGTRLECCLNGPHVAEITNIDEEGDFDYGEYESSADVDRFQCLTCGFVLEQKIENEDREYTLTQHDEVAKWCLDNCSQE